MQDILKTIQAMDKSSEEFFELYKAVDEKYWDFDEKDEDDVLRSAKVLKMLANRCDTIPEMTVAAGIIVNNVFEMLEQKQPVRTGMFKFKDKDVYFRIADHPDSMDKMQKMLSNTVIVKAKEQDAQF